MQLHYMVNTLGQDLLRRYGEKVHKLTLHGGFSCPNRDGTLGNKGCTFCNVASFADEGAKSLSVIEQLAARADEVTRAKKYFAYFQAYTSTYAEVDKLKLMYEQALKNANIVGLCVGTRPDCVPDAVLDLLCQYCFQGYEIWLELGLQTANDSTLNRINRGHDFACYQAIAKKARRLGLKVCTHLIVGLPGENKRQHVETLEKIVATGTDGIKLHPLHIVQGSVMAKAWRAGRMSEIAMADYVESATEMIIRTPPEIVYHRVSATARKPTLLAPHWCEGRWIVLTEIFKVLEQKGAQGSFISQPFTFKPFNLNNA